MTEGEGIESGHVSIKKERGSKGENKRNKEGRKLNLATVPRIYTRGGATTRKINHKITPDVIPGGIHYTPPV